MYHPAHLPSVIHPWQMLDVSKHKQTASVAKLVNAPDLKSGIREDLLVQVQPEAFAGVQKWHKGICKLDTRYGSRAVGHEPREHYRLYGYYWIGSARRSLKWGHSSRVSNARCDTGHRIGLDDAGFCMGGSIPFLAHGRGRKYQTDSNRSGNCLKRLSS